MGVAMLFHLFSVLHEVWDDILRTARREYGAVMRKRTGKRREMPISTAAFKCALFVFGVIAPSLIVQEVRAQGLDPTVLLKPGTDTWPTYNGDYSGARYSALDQINSENVASLSIAWAYRTPGHVLKATPLEVNGILYFTSPDHVWAVDARYGREIWHYHRASEGDHIGNRGVGMYKD